MTPDADGTSEWDGPAELQLLSEPIELTVEARAHGWRIDHYLSRLFPNHSREQFKKAIQQQAVLVNGLKVKAARRLRVNDRLSVRLPELPDNTLPPEDIPLEILYEDDFLVVVNKPADMIVHPGKGNYRGTLAGALQFHFDSLSDLAGQWRAGIVHRLDRDTSGAIVVAKNNQVHHRLSRQFERRSVEKEYRAITWGVINRDSDYIETHVRVHPKHREKMQVCPPGGNAREAVTFFEVLERFEGFSYVRLRPQTGRTHQLRLHMQHIGHSIVADWLYGGPGVRWSVERDRLERTERKSESDPTLISRQALHAYRLKFTHPRPQSANATHPPGPHALPRDEPYSARVAWESGNVLAIQAPLPADFQATLQALRNLSL